MDGLMLKEKNRFVLQHEVILLFFSKQEEIKPFFGLNAVIHLLHCNHKGRGWSEA